MEEVITEFYKDLETDGNFLKISLVKPISQH